MEPLQSTSRRGGEKLSSERDFGILKLPETGEEFEAARDAARRGTTLANEKRFGEAIASFEEAAQVDPSNAAYQYGLGYVLMRSERYEEAIIAFTKARNSGISIAEIDYYEARSLFETDNFGAAASLFIRCIDHYPNDWRMFHNLGYSYFMMGRYSDSVSAFEKALTFETGDVATGTLILLGDAYAAQSNVSKAVTSYRKAISLSPESVWARRSLGDTYVEAKRLNEAITVYKEALKLQPNNASLLNDLGYAYVLADRKDEALNSFDQALAIDPDDLHANRNRADLLAKLKRTDEAISTYRRIAKLDPQQSANVYEKIGWLFIVSKQYDEAIIAYDEGIKIDPSKAELHLHKGFALKKLGLFVAAAHSIDNAITADPYNSRYMTFQAQLLVQIGRIDEALSMAERAFASDSEDKKTRQLRDNLLYFINNNETRRKSSAHNDSILLFKGMSNTSDQNSNYPRRKVTDLDLEELSYMAAEAWNGAARVALASGHTVTGLEGGRKYKKLPNGTIVFDENASQTGFTDKNTPTP